MSHASVLIAIDDSNADMVSATSEAMAPFCENAGWFEDGTRWDWFVIGGRYNEYLNDDNNILVREIHPNKFQAKRVCEAEQTWQKMQAQPVNMWPFLFDQQADATLDGLILEAKRAWFPAHYAFLHAGRWHERERLGFFGCSVKTECEIASGQEQVHRCKAKAKGAPEAYIVSWGDDWATWDMKFYDRFIKPLAPDTRLVTVDYHI